MFVQQMFMPLTTFVLTDMGKGFVFGFVVHIVNANTLTVSGREPATVVLSVSSQCISQAISYGIAQYFWCGDLYIKPIFEDIHN
ncbi:MAG: hypothetical protein A3F68_03300 [Acidobacteria bacterium RIFCSPLOWO2_12_FULL_54_10]|nr:MAG: hypothetical protein A3F68_03300 [Acidobacteria bacterium RIFCSPLOWO2_12_FULL_54_10]